MRNSIYKEDDEGLHFLLPIADDTAIFCLLQLSFRDWPALTFVPFSVILRKGKRLSF